MNRDKASKALLSEIVRRRSLEAISVASKCLPMPSPDEDFRSRRHLHGGPTALVCNHVDDLFISVGDRTEGGDAQAGLEGL